jgi:Flp pilus assembly pilin Flp
MGRDWLVTAENGQTMAEYALVVGVMVTIAMLLVFGGFADTISNAFRAFTNLVF